VTRFLTRFSRDESGATAVEYAILLASIFLAIIVAVTLLSGVFGIKFNDMSDAIVSAG
jgi:pilus assembly protein Flp/PilA